MDRAEPGARQRGAHGRAGLLPRETRWGAGATFLDYDWDGFLDLFVSNYLHFDPQSTPGKGSDSNCT